MKFIESAQTRFAVALANIVADHDGAARGLCISLIMAFTTDFERRYFEDFPIASSKRLHPGHLATKRPTCSR
jgi:hypothetical protein